MKTKKCNLCKEEKPVDLFYRKARGKGGRSTYCKSCCRGRWKWTPSKEAGRIRYHRRKEAHPEAVRAADKVRYAIKTGKLKKPKYCQSCGVEQLLDGHHEDYTEPLEVVWLCRWCHVDLHQYRGAYEGNHRRDLVKS